MIGYGCRVGGRLSTVASILFGHDRYSGSRCTREGFSPYAPVVVTIVLRDAWGGAVAWPAVWVKHVKCSCRVVEAARVWRVAGNHVSRARS